MKADLRPETLQCPGGAPALAFDGLPAARCRLRRSRDAPGLVFLRPKAGEQGQELRGHTDVIQALAFRPDGKLLASCGYDRLINLWDMPATGQPIRDLKDHSDAVYGLCFSPDGKLLASAGADAVKVWDVESASACTRWANRPTGFTRPPGVPRRALAPQEWIDRSASGGSPRGRHRRSLRLRARGARHCAGLCSRRQGALLDRRGRPGQGLGNAAWWSTTFAKPRRTPAVPGVASHGSNWRLLDSTAPSSCSTRRPARSRASPCPRNPNPRPEVRHAFLRATRRSHRHHLRRRGHAPLAGRLQTTPALSSSSCPLLVLPQVPLAFRVTFPGHHAGRDLTSSALRMMLVSHKRRVPSNCNNRTMCTSAVCFDPAILRLTVCDTGPAFREMSPHVFLLARAIGCWAWDRLYHAAKQAQQLGYELKLSANAPGSVCFELLLIG